MKIDFSIATLKSLFKVSFSIVASKLSLLVLDVLIVNIFGISILTDSIILCLSITTGLINFYLIQINRNLVAIYSSEKKEILVKGIKNLLNLNIILFLPIVLVSIYYSENIVDLIFDKASTETLIFSSILVKYFLLLLLVNIIIYSISSYGIINDNPRILANSNIINTVTTSAFLLFKSRNVSNIESIGLAFLIGGICQLIYIFYNSGFPIKELLKKPELKLHKEIQIMFPILLIFFFSEFVKIYEKSISASLGAGVVSSLYYSHKLNLAPLGILTSVFGYLYLPKLSRNYSTDIKLFYKNTKKFFLVIIVFGFSLTIILNLLSSFLVDSFFNYTNKIKDTSLINNTFIWYNYSIVFYTIVQIGSMVLITMNRLFLAYVPLAMVFLIKLLLLNLYNYSSYLVPIKLTQIHMTSYIIGCCITLIFIFYQSPPALSRKDFFN
jgi:peptidoglycan biosynthesis protein MviN/MurJ (putative lipid II flippase)